MNWDLELLLVLAVAVTGALRYGYRLWLRGRPWPRHPPWPVDWSRAMFPVLLLVLALRTFVAEPFRIPSGSMMPTLRVGDLVLVSKYSYGLRLPVSHARVLETGAPARGDVAVFRYPKDPDIDYIKRVVGLPGDRVTYQGKRLTVNGRGYPQRAARPWRPERPRRPARDYVRAVEYVADARAHAILLDRRAPPFAHRFAVPPGHYLVLGDNRDHSSDSRMWGFVPESHLVGRAWLVWMNLDYLFGVFAEPRLSLWSRLGRIE